MSMEMHVFFRGKLPTKAALARAIKDLGFPLVIKPATGSLEQQSGYLPMQLNGEDTGIEFDVFDGRNNIEDIADDVDIDASFDRSANFRWGGDETEMLVAFCAAAALAQLTKGLVFEPDESPMSADEAADVARQLLFRAAAKPQVKGGTRPADIKRYLKPLLKQRSDLVLMGRLLVIRPVRHVLRGALLDRTSDKYRFNIWRYVEILYESGGAMGTVGYGDDLLGASHTVLLPHFEPLLMNTLAEDVFAQVGQITTLGQFADTLVNHPLGRSYDSTHVKALVLAGERDRAVDYVRELERRGSEHWYYANCAKEQWEFLARDIEDICAEAHAQEAQTVKAMKLEAIWEPSPFPVELPAHERAMRSSEPEFNAMPWISTPSWLLGDLPDQPGEVRYAKSIIYRKNGTFLLVPLSRDEAEKRHRNVEPYVLATRLPNGFDVLYHCGGREINDPWRSKEPDRFEDALLDIYSANLCAQFKIHKVRHRDQCAYFFTSEVEDWLCYVHLDEGEINRYDDRGVERIRTTPPLNEGDLDLVVFPIPEFGEVEDLVRRALAWLQRAGYGDLT